MTYINFTPYHCLCQQNRTIVLFLESIEILTPDKSLPWPLFCPNAKNARSQFLLKARCMGQHRAINAAASCAGFGRAAAVFCGNYAVLPNGCLAPLVFGLSGSLRGIPSHRARQIFEGLTAHTVGEKDFLWSIYFKRDGKRFSALILLFPCCDYRIQESHV